MADRTECCKRVIFLSYTDSSLSWSFASLTCDDVCCQHEIYCYVTNTSLRRHVFHDTRKHCRYVARSLLLACSSSVRLSVCLSVCPSASFAIPHHWCDWLTFIHSFIDLFAQ